MTNPDFDLDRIRREAPLAWLEYHDAIGSTNTRALELAAQGETRLPLLVLAGRQHAGRGRGSHRWWGGDGALTFSLLISGSAAEVPQKNWPLISLTTALAVSQVLEERLPAAIVRIKWPNDVYVNARKLSGILVETSANRPDALVVGVGINVNNSLDEAPPELRGTATSLVDLAQRTFDRTDLLVAVLRGLSGFLPQLSGECWQLADAWRQRCCLQGRTVQLDTGSRTVIGVCQGIDDQGALLLLAEGGVERCFGGVITKVL
jgi:BirA family biotin operon repressor/biotin-[acetyl-CoA-carboxylase] ligase